MSAPLQYSAEKRLVEALAKYEARGGSIIIMEARTGAVLAMANWPTFDLNSYERAEPAAWQNPSVGLLYEPGSIFKVVTYGAALETRTFTPDQQFNDTGSYEVIKGQKPIRNSQQRKLGWVTGWQALGESLNTVSADLAIKMGPEAFYRYIALFGFGRPTEVDLRAEAPGMVKRYGTEQWNLVDQATNSFGQAISVTPIQMINAVAAVANDGALLQPQVAQALVLNGQVHPLPVRKLEQVLTPETAQTLTQMMVYTVDNYTIGKKLVPGFKIAGKTGTAEIPEQQGYTNPLTITSFVGFLPAADPKIVVLVKIDEPKKSRWAEQVALPVFGDVARDAVQILGLAPNGEMP
jgi:cell division protein FtsI (penicillin-binding protein 3)